MVATVDFDHLGRPHTETELQCPQCDKNIHLGEEVVVLRVIRPEGFDPATGVTFSDFLDEEEDDFLYTPFTFHRACWAEVFTDYEESIKDDKPVLAAGGVVECDGCTSDIMRGEVTGLVTPGTLVLSRRRPNGEPALGLSAVTASLYICIACLVGINTSHLEMWEGLSQDGECDNGLKERCWRTGCQHKCKYSD